ncbi:LytR C-terminal domain-containing protein [Streptomyces tubbatahanensis]|uniref:LytR C-terminal domain-containing protein n=1 Tax=Streptomyces tubbatahanensis TaxID=2923272 RepID=A0ABY3XRB8_9ACTN|nr:LCP family protein [Streptomyces tubbatahanensis]UNS96978.1 LytR C-terminal domain-containing protein [Streptomyces tubbatahanensis]
MSDGYGYDPYAPQPEIIGYDEYGRPVYRRQDAYDQPYGAQSGYGAQGGYEAQSGYEAQGGYDAAAGQGGYGTYDPYGQAGAAGQQPGHDAYSGHPDTAPQQGGHAGTYGYGAHAPYGQQPAAPQQSQHTRQQAWFPEQAPAPAQEQYAPEQAGQEQYAPEQAGQGTYGPGEPSRERQAPEQAQQGQHPPGRPPQARQQSGGGEDGYQTEQFSFVEEASDESEDVIDWLKFSESRTERREEAKRRGRNRIVALVVVLALVVAGGVGYLWYAGMLPGTGGDEHKSGAAAGKHRDVIVVHLREENGDSSTALLVDNAGTGQGTSLLLPNALAVTTEDGTTTTLGKSVDDQGAGPTRDALNTLLGSDIKGTWRLDTPFLEKLVELVGGISVDTDTAVPGEKKGSGPLVEQGSAQEMDGRAAVAYATYRAQGEPQDKQLARFGRVMRAVLKKVSSEPRGATRTVESLGQIPDPSLSEPQLGASLAKLAAHAKKGDYRSQVVPVRANGTLSGQVSDRIVGKVLGGTVKNSDPDAAPRVSLKNATGKRGLDATASVALVNGGYTVVKGGTGATRTTSLVTYAEAAQKSRAEQVAKTLGLPGSAVRKGEDTTANADVTVELGADYEG